jgi:signal transduction histidine kinase
MMQGEMDDTGVRVRLWGKEMAIVVSEDRVNQIKAWTGKVLREPFSKRTWSEFFFVVVGLPMALFGIVFVGVTMAAGIFFAITFIGVAFIALSIRGARGIGGFHRGIARGLLGLEIEDPEPFAPRPGFLGWLQSSLRDRVGWRAMGYIMLKAVLMFVAVLAALPFWWDAFTCLTYPLWSGNSSSPNIVGLPVALFRSGFYQNPGSGFFQVIGVFLTGVLLLLAAPWAIRVVIYLDRFLMQSLLAPDSITARVRSLEYARAQTVDASAATLRRIERDLHDGTQAQLVALAMRLGMAKEKLAESDQPDLDRVRELVDDAHRGAKEAIVELRDLARGIHPPALDIGLEGALSTLAARSTVPTELTLALRDRPTPAIEAIAYFCVAELLANVAQHANASRASISCAQQGAWLRVVVRDDGIGGAQLSTLGSASSGLSGLTDRVHAVDGRLDITSPLRGPTVVTVDLPLHA